MATRTIVYAGIIAAAYAVITLAFGPISYGPVQFRVAGLLKPLALFHPAMSLALAFGVFLANLASPFGFWDWGIMPFVAFGAAHLCWRLRRWPVLSLVLHAALIACGVAFFPLGIVAGLPFWPVVLWIFVSECILYLAGYFAIWRRYGDILLNARTHLLRRGQSSIR